MKEFRVFVADRAGELARVTEALSAAAVNIRAIASESRSCSRLSSSDSAGFLSNQLGAIISAAPPRARLPSSSRIRARK